jgi:hypothetical protein
MTTYNYERVNFKAVQEPKIKLIFIYDINSSTY